MKLEFICSEKLLRADRRYSQFAEFVQRMINRIVVGHIRYGVPEKTQNYMTRMIMEVKAYKRSGNLEHLINISNYCFLESLEPENSKFHFNNTVKSATRK